MPDNIQVIVSAGKWRSLARGEAVDWITFYEESEIRRIFGENPEEYIVKLQLAELPRRSDQKEDGKAADKVWVIVKAEKWKALLRGEPVNCVTLYQESEICRHFGEYPEGQIARLQLTERG